MKLTKEQQELINWEPKFKRAFLVSIRKRGMEPNNFITDYRPSETAEEARRDALMQKDVVEVRVKDMGLTWPDMERELPGGDKFSWQGD